MTTWFIFTAAAILAAAIAATAAVVHFDRLAVLADELAACEARLTTALVAADVAANDADWHRQYARQETAALAAVRAELSAVRAELAELGETADRHECEGAWARHQLRDALAGRERIGAALASERDAHRNAAAAATVARGERDAALRERDRIALTALNAKAAALEAADRADRLQRVLEGCDCRVRNLAGRDRR